MKRKQIMRYWLWVPALELLYVGYVGNLYQCARIVGCNNVEPAFYTASVFLESAWSRTLKNSLLIVQKNYNGAKQKAGVSRGKAGKRERATIPRVNCYK